MKKRLPIFATADDRAKYLAAYEAMFTLWTVPHDAIDVHGIAYGPRLGILRFELHILGYSCTVKYRIGHGKLYDRSYLPAQTYLP